jgi:spermidine/putrescine transport system permease protein
MRRYPFPFFVTCAVLIFLYLPIAILILNSFNESRFGTDFTGFSLKWYQQLAKEPEMWKALKNSLIIGISATVASTFLGTAAALALHFYKSKLQKVHWGLIYFPLILPDILMGISLLLFFISVNLQLGLLTVFIAHTTFCVSYVAMVILARLQNFDYRLVEAAQDLGAGSWVVFRSVLLPFLTPGIIAGALLAFTLSIDDFVITFFVAGKGANTLPIYIYSLIKYGSTPIINALSFIMLTVTFIIVFFIQRLVQDDRGEIK